MRQCYAAGPSAPDHVANPNRFGIVHGDDHVDAATASPAGAGMAIEHPVSADTTVDAGDSVYVIGQYDDLLGLLQRS